MLVKDLITDSIPPVKLSDEASVVLAWMNEFKVSHLPVISNGELAGIISEDDLLEIDKDTKTIADLRRVLPDNLYIFEESHLFDAFRVMSMFRLSILPVLENSMKYSGLVTRSDLIHWAAEGLGTKEPGGIIELEVQHNSYSLSEIGRICESNDAKVLSLLINPSHDKGILLITLKVNIREMSRLISTFERFEYKISSVVFDADQLFDFREDYENLLRYLNI